VRFEEQQIEFVFPTRRSITILPNQAMHTQYICILGAALAAIRVHCQTTSAAAVSQVFQFPKDYWIENIAVRANGNLLLTRMDKAEVHELNPLEPNAKPKLVYGFAGANGCMGITETSPDNFAVTVTTRQGFSVRSAIWNLNVSSAEVKATKVADNISVMLNGLALFSPGVVVATDTIGGNIYRIDLKTGSAAVAYNQAGRGVNGVRVKGKYVYYANLFSGVFGRIPVDPATGSATGPSETVGNVGAGADDFALSPFSEEAYVVNQSQNQVVRVSLNETGKVASVAGSANSGAIGTPTSAQFGRTSKDGRTLYVTTSGKSRLSGAGDGGGKVVAVKF
jgi:hypothetical protein